MDNREAKAKEILYMAIEAPENVTLIFLTKCIQEYMNDKSSYKCFQLECALAMVMVKIKKKSSKDIDDEFERMRAAHNLFNFNSKS
jgi:hypothetical protein